MQEEKKEIIEEESVSGSYPVEESFPSYDSFDYTKKAMLKKSMIE